MGRKVKILSLLLVVLLLLSGCNAVTVADLYCLPKRSEEHHDLQKAVEQEMGELSYCAPQSGENLQAVQNADLDGDGVDEYLLFAKGNSDKPLQILIFHLEQEEYVLADTISSAGSAFDVVEYARIDDKPGVELVVGCQVSNQVARSVSVYSYRGGRVSSLMTAQYTKFLPCDLDSDGRSELMVLHPGESDESNGLAEMYVYSHGEMVRSPQVRMSESVDRIKRIVVGKLHGGKPAVYVATAVGENAIITDVFSLVDGSFTNVSFSNDSGTSVQTLRNYFVYADDVDSDGVVELPDLITMYSPVNTGSAGRQYLIRWYAMTAKGGEFDKLYTYHNYQGGWYLTLGSEWAPRVAVVQLGTAFEFYIWDKGFIKADKLLTIHALTGADRDEQAAQTNRLILYRTDSVIYASDLEVASTAYGITKNSLIQNFHLIREDWNTGET